MALTHLDPRSAANAMQKEKNIEFIDVRTVEEFNQGHPRGTKNIPIFKMDPRTGQKIPNLEFKKVVEKNIPKEKTIFLICGSGQRSMMAGMQMETFGFEKLVNIKGGFWGSESTSGWKEQDLPVCEKDCDCTSYQTLEKNPS